MHTWRASGFCFASNWSRCYKFSCRNDELVELRVCLAELWLKQPKLRCGHPLSLASERQSAGVGGWHKMVKAPLLMRSQRVHNPTNCFFSVHFSKCCFFSFHFFTLTHTAHANTYTHSCSPHTFFHVCCWWLQAVEVTLWVRLGVKGGCEMSRHLGKAYCSLNYYFKLAFAGDNKLPPPFAKLLTGLWLCCAGSSSLLVCVEACGEADFHLYALLFNQLLC